MMLKECLSCQKEHSFFKIYLCQTDNCQESKSQRMEKMLPQMSILQNTTEQAQKYVILHNETFFPAVCEVSENLWQFAGKGKRLRVDPLLTCTRVHWNRTALMDNGFKKEQRVAEGDPNVGL